MEGVIEKLKYFIRRYHLTLLAHNILFFAIIILLTLSFFAFVEYTFWLNTPARKSLFIIVLLILFIAGIFQFLLPFINISRFKKTINDKQAADIIGKFFPEIQDKFRNFLELKELSNVSREKQQLLIAAIEQKANEIQPYKFTKAINYKPLKKIIFAIGIIFSALLLLTFTYPEITLQPIERIVNYNNSYTKPAPFEFILKTEILSGTQGESVSFELLLNGTKLPAEAHIQINDNIYPMRKISNTEFLYTVQQLKSNFTFRFLANGYFSKKYYFSVSSKPTILSFQTMISYPAYIKKANETVQNTTNFLIPENTQLNWAFIGQDIDSIEIVKNDKKTIIAPQSLKKNLFAFSEIYKQNTTLKIIPFNEHKLKHDTLTVFVEVIPDIYPSIQVFEINDSIMLNRTYFRGLISDDYGFSALNFYIKKQSSDKFEKYSIPYTPYLINQEFFYMFDFSVIDEWRTSTIEYYFEVADNDNLNGFKRTKTTTRFFTYPDTEELQEAYSQKQQQLQENLSSTMKSVQDIQDEIKQVKMDMLNKKSLSWDDKTRIEQLIEKQKHIEEQIEKMSQDNLDKNLFEELMKDLPQDLLEKQKKLEELFNQIFDEETKEMLQKLQEMLFEMNRENIMEQLNKIQNRTEEISRELDRNLELFKQLEFEKKMNDMLEKLEETKENLDNLANKTKDNPKDENLLSEQNKINKEFEEIQEELSELKQESKELSEPMPFPDTSELEQEISDALEKAKQELSKNKNSNAQQNQKKGAEKMEQLSNKIQSSMDQYMEETLGEDIDNLNRILKNLIHLSFFQEEIINSAYNINRLDPRYAQILGNQKKLNSRFQIVEDSLHALSKRQIAIQSVVTKDLNKIKQLSEKIDGFLEKGAIALARIEQQYLMQSANNLALLLIEALQEMNNEMAMQSSGEGGNCKMKSKGSGQPNKASAKSMRQLQEQLNQQMEKMMQQMKGGGQPSSSQMSEQFAKMAAMQEAIRQQVQEYKEMMLKSGEGNLKELNEILQEMEKTERDLVNKRLNTQVMERQKDILVRLLESEKGEMTRDKEEKRTSKTAKFINNSNLEEVFQYNRKKESTDEMIKYIPPVYNSFYRQKVNQFIILLSD